MRYEDWLPLTHLRSLAPTRNLLGIQPERAEKLKVRKLCHVYPWNVAEWHIVVHTFVFVNPMGFLLNTLWLFLYKRNKHPVLLNIINWLLQENACDYVIVYKEEKAFGELGLEVWIFFFCSWLLFCKVNVSIPVSFIALYLLNYTHINPTFLVTEIVSPSIPQMLFKPNCWLAIFIWYWGKSSKILKANTVNTKLTCPIG